MHFEEIDLCWRLRLAGWRVAAVPASTVFHYGARSLPSDSFYKVYLNHRNNLVVLIKNLPASRLLWLLPVRLLLELVASLQYLLRGRLASTLAPPLGMLWLLSHPLALWRRRRSSRRLVIEEGDQRTDGVYSGSALLSYFLGGRRRSDELIVEAAE